MRCWESGRRISRWCPLQCYWRRPSLRWHSGDFSPSSKYFHPSARDTAVLESTGITSGTNFTGIFAALGIADMSGALDSPTLGTQTFSDILCWRRYDLLLRTHEDNFVGPGLLTYRPPNTASFARGSSCRNSSCCFCIRSERGSKEPENM